MSSGKPDLDFLGSPPSPTLGPPQAPRRRRRGFRHHSALTRDERPCIADHGWTPCFFYISRAAAIFFGYLGVSISRTTFNFLIYLICSFFVDESPPASAVPQLRPLFHGYDAIGSSQPPPHLYASPSMKVTAPFSQIKLRVPPISTTLLTFWCS